MHPVQAQVQVQSETVTLRRRAGAGGSGSSRDSDISYELCVHHWNRHLGHQPPPPAAATAAPTPSSLPAPGATPSAAVVVIYHGFLAHGLYPTVRYAAEALAAAGHLVVAADLPGHGRSPGLRGYLPPPEALVQIGADVADYARGLATALEPGAPGDRKLFLLGSSLGGAMALAVAHHMQPPLGQSERPTVDGVVLLAPMLRLGIDAPVRYLLGFLAAIAPTLQIIPSSSTNLEKQYRDPQKRQECQSDALSISGSSIRIGSARTCVELANHLEDRDVARTFRVPCLVLVALQDVVVDPQGAIDFFQRCPAPDKTLKKYPALHGLLCEPVPLFETIRQDLLGWIRDRV